MLCWPALARAGFVDQQADTAGGNTFLPVEQAYQIDVTVAAPKLIISWTIAPGYYLYRERMAIHVERDGQPVSIAPQFSKGSLKYDELFERETEIFHDHASATLDALPASPYILTVEYQGCADAGLCYPPQKQAWKVTPDLGRADLLLSSAPTATSNNAATANNTAAAIAAPVTTSVNKDQATPNLPIILAMALLGGLILNLMPCVFPVLSLKLFAMAGKEASDEVRGHSWLYALGVMLSFLLVAGILLALRAAGEAIGWGFQLQEPLFVSLLVYLFFVLGLAFSGIVHIGGSLMGFGQQLVAGNGYRSAFFTGVLAVVVASPCSVPFMGVATGYAITQSAAIALLVFVMLGFGMALPFILLAYWPALLRSLPAPGAWMERFRQLLAFPLYASALWLLYVLGQQSGQMAIFWILGGLILLVLAGWLWRDASAHPSEKLLAMIVLLIALLLPNTMIVKSRASDHASAHSGEAYSAARLAQLRADGEPVFINLTAAWCLTCVVNEKVALARTSVQQRMQERGITYLVGDWTNRNPEITTLLQQFGRSGVPLYLYYPPGRDSNVIVLPQVLTESGVLDVLR